VAAFVNVPSDRIWRADIVVVAGTGRRPQILDCIGGQCHVHAVHHVGVVWCISVVCDDVHLRFHQDFRVLCASEGTAEAIGDRCATSGPHVVNLVGLANLHGRVAVHECVRSQLSRSEGRLRLAVVPQLWVSFMPSFHGGGSGLWWLVVLAAALMLRPKVEMGVDLI